MKKLTKEQAVIISAYTGVLCCNFSDMHEYVEKLLGRPVWTHEFGSKLVKDEIEAKSKSDFLSICPVD